MFRKLTCSFSLALVLSLTLTNAARAELVGWWRLEEGSGDTASDNSGNGHDGKLLGTPEWGPGAEGSGGGVVLNPDKCLGIDCGAFDPTDGTGQFTFALWAFWEGTGTFQHFLTKSNGWGAATMMFQVELWGAHTDATYTDRVGISYQPAGSIPFSIMPKNEWVHLALTFDGTNAILYVNGIDQDGPKALSIGPNIDASVFIGVDYNGGRVFEGSLDEVRIYSHALSGVEVLGAMKGEPWPYAFSPNPEDGALNPDTWVNLTWSPGDFAVSHDVYLGDNFDDVNDGTGEAFRGNQTSTMFMAGFPGFAYPDGLAPGTTYYWRIDEVNDTNAASPWKGPVWSFSIPPKTAYNPNPADGAEFVDPNAVFSWTPGFGAKLHTVYIGTDFDDMNNAAGGAPQGISTHTPGPLELEKVYYWRVDEFDALATYKGDIWSFTTPGATGSLQPANGAANVQINSTLNWTPATNAASHDVYFGTDKDAVKNATTASTEYKGNKTSGSESYDPGKLAWHSDYYWRVDAVYNTGMVKGLVWSFTTADFFLVDDFESYNDIDPPDPESNRIFDKWIDGFGTTDNGALVGNDLPPYAEQTVVHGGAQSLVYRYDNNLKTSEATLTLVSRRDWTEEGVGKLSLWFRGDSANAPERMFVALNGSAVVYHDDPAATQIGRWTRWVIDLQAFADQGVVLTNVNTITIGFGTKNSPAAGGAGTMYFDDIRLYR
ncbi:MAG: LamG domain-containing protein [Planctomycetota bacterium]